MAIVWGAPPQNKLHSLMGERPRTGRGTGAFYLLLHSSFHADHFQLVDTASMQLLFVMPTLWFAQKSCLGRHIVRLQGVGEERESVPRSVIAILYDNFRLCPFPCICAKPAHIKEWCMGTVMTKSHDTFQITVAFLCVFGLEGIVSAPWYSLRTKSAWLQN